MGYFNLAGWLALKLCLLAGAILSGLGIRIELVRYFRICHEIGAEGSSADRKELLRRRYSSSTAILIMLWLFIAGIVALSLFKP